MSDDAQAGPYYFPSAPTRGIEISAKRILVVSCHHSLWLGTSFSDFRETPEARRAHAFLMFIVDVALRSKNIGCFETVYDSVYEKIGMKRAVFIRFWVFLETDERADAFNAQAQEMTSRDEVVTAKQKKRKFVDDVLPRMGSHLVASPLELGKCLIQQRLSHVDESIHVTFDHAGAVSDIGACDLDDDVGGADDMAEVGDDPRNSLVARLAATLHFDHSVTTMSAEANRVSLRDRSLSSYLTCDRDGIKLFTVPPGDRLGRFRVVDARAESNVSWLESAAQLLTFKHPYFVPSHHELENWLQSQASVVGISSMDIESMSASELASHVDELMLSPVLYAPIPEITAGVSSGASTWSDCRYEEVYPANAAWMASCRRDASVISRAVTRGDLPSSELRHNEEHVLSELNLFASASLKGWPPAYANVRRACTRDIFKFNEVMESADEFGRETTAGCMFLAEAGLPENMSFQTFCLVQFVELMRCEFGLDRPQTHMNTVIYPWSFVLLVPAFGYPGSIQARGPCGSGKGESKKRLQPCVNEAMWFNVDSISEMGTTYGGLPEQCFWDMDENTAQGKQAGSTLTQQTTDSNGISKRARANAELKRTECVAVAVRHVNLGSFNVPLPPALADRAINIDLPRSFGDLRTAVTRGSPYIAACFRILTGLSAWVWLYDMAGLFTWDETVFDMFVGINSVIIPDSKLARHARTKESIRILAIGITVFEIVSTYYRRRRGVLAEDGTYEFLSFVRANAMLSPSAVWESYLLITTGQDPRRDTKVLSIFKDNLRRVSGGMYETDEADLYYLSTFVKPSADIEPKEFLHAADACGLGHAIASEGLSHLLQSKDASTGHPTLKLLTETAGSARQRYLVLISAVTSMSVLTKAEAAILECLSVAAAAGNVCISADETQFVFKEPVRNAILSPSGQHPMLQFGRRDILAADDLLSRMPTLGYSSVNGLVADVAVVHPTRLDTSQEAVVGGPLDPDGIGVFFGSMPFGQVLVVDTEGLKLYERLRDGLSPAENCAQTSSRQLGSTFFRACGAPVGERVFGGVGSADEVNDIFSVGGEGDGKPVHITNSRYTQRARRLTASVVDPRQSVLFKSHLPVVAVDETLYLCRKINAFNANRYPDTAGKAYNYT